jgi:ribosomal protein S18 acetylase RimI-like enzyme
VHVRVAQSLAEVDAAYELAAQTFGPNYFEAREALIGVREMEPLKSLEDAVLVVNGESVVGFVRILDRKFHSPAGLVQGGGITSVCIHPDLRGEGWGVRVMEAALERSQQRGDVFSILFARRAVDGWYPKLGYVGMGCHVAMSLDQGTHPDSLPIYSGATRVGVERSYLGAYADAYSDDYRDLFLSFHRDGEWWESLEARLAPGSGSGQFVNLIVGETLIGYFIIRDASVIELSASAGHRAECAAGILRFYDTQYGTPPVLRLPSRHWIMRLFSGTNHTLSIRYSWDGGHMVRILNQGAFKDLVAAGVDCAHRESVETLFSQYDVSRHEEARQLLADIVGASCLLRCAPDAEGAVIPSQGILKALPTWSAMDEL